MKPLIAFLSVAALVSAAVAEAGQATSTWVHPTTNTDSSPLPLNEITSTRVEWGTCSGSAFGTAQGQVVVPAPATSTVTNNLAPGTYCFRAFTTAHALESGPSSVQQKTIIQAPPNPPTLTVTVATVYQFKQKGNRMEMYVAGLIVPGSACDPSVKVGDLYMVSNSDVTFAKNNYANNTSFAQCAVSG